MSGKRSAEQSINQQTLEHENNISHLPLSSDAPRTILQVQRDQAGPVLKQDTGETPKNEAPSKEEKPKIKPLFSDLFLNKKEEGYSGGVGIFTAAKQGLLKTSTEQPKIDFKSPNLFNNNGFNSVPPPAPTTSLFSNNNKQSLFGNSGSLFGSGGGLFGSKEGGSIFNFQQGSIPPVKNGEEGGDDEGDSAQLQKGQEMQVDKSKSKVNFQYAEEVKILFSGIVRKYKRNNGDLMEGVEAVLQYDPKTQLAYLVIRLLATKHSIFTGYVLKGKSEVRVLNKKEENLQVAVFTLSKDKPAQLDRLKLQLDTPQNGQILKNQLKLAIAGELVLPKDNNDEPNAGEKVAPSKDNNSKEDEGKQKTSNVKQETPKSEQEPTKKEQAKQQLKKGEACNQQKK